MSNSVANWVNIYFQKMGLCSFLKSVAITRGILPELHRGFSKLLNRKYLFSTSKKELAKILKLLAFYIFFSIFVF